MDDTHNHHPSSSELGYGPDATISAAPSGTAMPTASTAVPGGTPTNDVRVDVRCSVLVWRGDSVLLLGRVAADTTLGQELRHLTRAGTARAEEPQVWVLPGGRPIRGESTVACARRETREETGMHVDVGRCQFVLEVAETGGDRTIDLVFTATPVDPQQEPTQAEEALLPRFVPLADLRHMHLQPPIAGYLRGLPRRRDHGAPYLGNLWRPNGYGNDDGANGAVQ
jgi:8-oxo-dGTP diphosphatase